MNPKEGGQGRGVIPNKGDVVRERIAGFVRGLRGIQSGVREHPVQAGTVAVLAAGGALSLANPSEANAATPDGQKNAISQPDTTQRIIPIGLKVGVFEGFPIGVQQKVVAQEEPVVSEEVQKGNPPVQEEVLGEPPPEAPEEVPYENQQTGGVENENGIDQPAGLEPRPLQGGGGDPVPYRSPIEVLRSLGLEGVSAPAPMHIIAGGDIADLKVYEGRTFKVERNIKVMMPRLDAIIPEELLGLFQEVVSGVQPGSIIIPKDRGFYIFEGEDGKKVKFVDQAQQVEIRYQTKNDNYRPMIQWDDTVQRIVATDGYVETHEWQLENTWKEYELKERRLLGSPLERAKKNLIDTKNLIVEDRGVSITNPIKLDDKEIETFLATGSTDGFKSFVAFRGRRGEYIFIATGEGVGISDPVTQQTINKALLRLDEIDSFTLEDLWKLGLRWIVFDPSPQAFSPDRNPGYNSSPQGKFGWVRFNEKASNADQLRGYQIAMEFMITGETFGIDSLRMMDYIRGAWIIEGNAGLPNRSIDPKKDKAMRNKNWALAHDSMLSDGEKEYYKKAAEQNTS